MDHICHVDFEQNRLSIWLFSIALLVVLGFEKFGPRSAEWTQGLNWAIYALAILAFLCYIIRLHSLRCVVSQ